MGDINEAILQFASHIEKSIDVETGRRHAWVRSGFLTVLQKRKDDLIRQKHVDNKYEIPVEMVKPFTPGIWYAKRATHFDELVPRWGHIPFEAGEPMIVLRCSGFHRGLGSWWWIVDKNGSKKRILWRFRPTFNQDWEKG